MAPTTTPTARRATPRRNRASWAVIAVAAVAVALFSIPPYLTYDADASRIPLDPANPRHFLWVTLHAFPGVLALVVGPFQFVTALRRRHPGLHRILGRIYLLAVLFGSIIAVPAAIASTSGLAAQVAFLLLAAGWVYTGIKGYRTARRRQFLLHQVWMVRNYALTFSAVMLRVFLGVGTVAMSRYPSLDFGEVYTASAWAGILVSSLVAEWFVVQRKVDGTVSRTPSARPASSPS